MKKNVFTFLGISALFFLMHGAWGTAQGATVIYETTNNASAKDGEGSYYGFAVKLDWSGLTTTTTTADADASSTLPRTVYLNSLTLRMRSKEDSTENSFKVAVYAHTSDGTVGGFVGLSDAQPWSSGTDLTFSFDSLAISSSSTYQYLFVMGTTTIDDLTVLAGDTTALSAYQAKATSEQIRVQQTGTSEDNLTSLPSGSGTYKAKALNNWEGQYIPKMTFSVSNERIPEPATASLGLLGLAGLLLRRRRSR